MSLRSRLAAGELEQIANGDPHAADAAPSARDEIERNVHFLLVEDLGAEIDTAAESDIVLRQRIERKLTELLAQETAPLSAADRREITNNVLDNILGYGPIQALIDDPTITEVMVNNPESIYVEREGRIHKTSRRFLDERHLLRIIDKIVSRVGRRIDEASPMVDARLPDGSRVNAIIHPLAINGPMLTIRKFSQ